MRNLTFMRHKFLVLPVKKLLKSVHIYGSYRKIKTVFWNTLYLCKYYNTVCKYYNFQPQIHFWTIGE